MTKNLLEYHGNFLKLRCISCGLRFRRDEFDLDSAVTIIEINTEPTPLTEERISDYLILGKTGAILPSLVEEAKKIRNQTIPSSSR